MLLLSQYQSTHFKGIAFDREVLLCCQDIDKEGGRIKGEGIELFFPNDALPPGQTSTIKIFASTDGPTEHSSLFSVSPIFHVKCEPYREFQKEVQVTIEHFTKLEVEEDIENLVFMVSRKDEEEFSPAAGRVVAELGSRFGTVKVNHFSRFGFFKRRGIIFMLNTQLMITVSVPFMQSQNICIRC